MTQAPSEPSTSDLGSLLDLEAIGSDIFRSRHTEPNLSGALYGGQVLAQALRASLHTVGDRPVHSLHGYFVRAGSEQEPVVYQVERVRDGRNFTTRRVTGLQSRTIIFHMEASFHEGGEGVAHAEPAPKTTAPEESDAVDPFERALLDDQEPGAPPAPILLPLVERRMVDAPRDSDGGRSRRQLWMRARASGLQDAQMRACGLAYLSDFWLGGMAKGPHPEALRQRLASLDHAMWFHEDADPTDWLLYDMQSPWAGASRGLSNGRIHDRAGRLVASVAQEVYFFPGQYHHAPRVGEL